jgi:hypothetical protein
MLYHNFYSIFFCYLPLTEPNPRNLYGCSYTDIKCPVPEVNSSSRQMSPTSHLKKETDQHSETLCSFVS